MHENYEIYEIYERGMGASRYTPWVCFSAVWNGSGEELPLGYARQLDSNGGMRDARA